MFEVFFKIDETLQEIRDLMVKMEKHLNDLTDPPNLNEWAKYKKEVDKNDRN
jgi:hypothetical protein